MTTPRKAAPANEYEADELQMHIDNTRRLYDQKRAIELLLLRKVKAGKYSHALAPKAFLYVAEAGAKDYRREYGADDPRSFNPATRLVVAKAFVREFEAEHDIKVANPAKRRMTMADVKRRAAAAGSHYFDRGNSKFFGGDRFSGPYAGPGGVFFVQSNKSGISVRPVESDGRIGYLAGNYSSVVSARAAAKAMAKRA